MLINDDGWFQERYNVIETWHTFGKRPKETAGLASAIENSFPNVYPPNLFILWNLFVLWFFWHFFNV